MEIAAAGFRVIGIDRDATKIATLKQGKSYILDVPEGRNVDAVQTQQLTATSDFGALANADAVSICVPTPLSKSCDSDISLILSATETIRKNLHRPS
jgi:UDP-N-acetyl-D-glucosamine dehydrogenase